MSLGLHLVKYNFDCYEKYFVEYFAYLLRDCIVEITIMDKN